jgi:hypothetical protein
VNAQVLKELSTEEIEAKTDIRVGWLPWRDMEDATLILGRVCLQRKLMVKGIKSQMGFVAHLQAVARLVLTPFPLQMEACALLDVSFAPSLIPSLPASQPRARPAQPSSLTLSFSLLPSSSPFSTLLRHSRRSCTR